MELSNICEYSSKRIDSSLLTVENYVSTENMMQNKGGITLASKVPVENSVEFLPGDILISNIRPYFRKIWLSDKKGGCSSDVLCIRALPGTDSTYLYYLLSQDSFFDYVMSGAKGCKMPRGDKSQIMQWDVALPNFEEQHRIASILKSIDDKIQLNNRINHNLEQQAQALYKSWFVDFEPFRGGKFVDSELGLIPEGWSTISFKDFLTPISRKVPVGLYPEYSVTNTGLIPRSEKFKKQLSSNSSQNKELRKYDIVFGMSREILNWGIMLEDVGSVSSAYSIYGINENLIHPLYLKYYIEQRSWYFNDLIGTAAREGQSLDKGALMQKYATVPTSSVFLSFMERDNAYREQILALDSETKHLESLRDAILPKLMSGELKINDLTC